MCGIFAVFSRAGKPIRRKRCKSCLKQSLREIAYQQSGKQRHRGPDDTGIEVIDEKGIAMVHERLAIVGVLTGHQPLKSSDDNIILVANGEIYNYPELRKEIEKKRGIYKPKSDCSVIIELYEEYGEKLFEHITGMYAFALYDKDKEHVLLARDPYGIISMYYGWDDDENLWVASEMKCLVDVCTKIEVFPPGKMLHGRVESLKLKSFYQPAWYRAPLQVSTDLTKIREVLESAVRSHLECEVPLGALLSGGVDSSLIASIATKIKRETDPDFKLRTFSVGLAGAPDFVYSRKVADHIKSIHTEVLFTTAEGLDCIRDIIHKLETYDVSTVRCSIPMYITTRYIKSQGIKMILSGEGADEIFGGYLYFFKAPTPEDFHAELVTRVQNLHLSDCLRANKSTMAWGVELRVPYLDKDFVDLVMSIDPAEKIPGAKNTFVSDNAKRLHSPKMEKHVLREAFDEGYLPDDVLWRQKEQLSDGVGYSWIEAILDFTASQILDEDFEQANEIYPINTPSTKEAFYYRTIFNELFPGNHCVTTVEKWAPRTDWGCSEDPSGLKQSAHEAYK